VELLGLILFILNTILVIIITRKINLLVDLKQEYRQIEKSISEMVKENSRIVEVILTELESKIEETKMTTKLSELKQTTPDLECKREVACFEEELLQESSMTIDLHKQGMSIQEIASRCSISQGEIKLKLKLYEQSQG
jgi:predicted nuclease with TOPRIM domain